jgi:hypothetical protein
VQIELNPAYEARRGRRATPRAGDREDINVWQPPGGSNAIAPVIVTVPTPGGAPDPVHTFPYPRPRDGAAGLAGWLGAAVAVGFAIMIALIVGPLTGEIGALNEDRVATALAHQTVVQSRDQEIRSLTRENRRLQDTVSRLASRRGQPAARSDQPTRTLPDTDSSGPLAASPSSIAQSSAIGAP